MYLALAFSSKTSVCLPSAIRYPDSRGNRMNTIRKIGREAVSRTKEPRSRSTPLKATGRSLLIRVQLKTRRTNLESVCADSRIRLAAAVTMTPWNLRFKCHGLNTETSVIAVCPRLTCRDVHRRRLHNATSLFVFSVLFLLGALSRRFGHYLRQQPDVSGPRLRYVANEQASSQRQRRCGRCWRLPTLWDENGQCRCWQSFR